MFRKNIIKEINQIGSGGGEGLKKQITKIITRISAFSGFNNVNF